MIIKTDRWQGSYRTILGKFRTVIAGLACLAGVLSAGAASFVDNTGAYLSCSYHMDGDEQGLPKGDFYWSIDNGKTLTSFDSWTYEYPLNPGTVTVKFYDKTGNWRAADWVCTVEKRRTYRDEDGYLHYTAPVRYDLNVKFVPARKSTSVKLDANGGSGSKETFQVDGYAYGSLPVPSRKGYVFAGWWTAKNGGEHVVLDKIFATADFAGQKTPTIYAHWLQLRKITLKDDNAYAEWSLDEASFEDSQLFAEVEASYKFTHPRFQDEDDYEDDYYYDDDDYYYGDDDDYGSYLGCQDGKGVLEVLPGARVDMSAWKRIEGKNGSELKFEKWTVSPSKLYMGPDFRVTRAWTQFTMPDADVSLQTTYIDEYASYSMHRVAAIAIASPVLLDGDATIEPPYGAFEWSPDGGKTWYKVSSDSSSDDDYYDDDYYDDDYYDDDYYDDDYYDDDESGDGEYALVKGNSCTVTWRSNDPCWQAPDKVKITFWGSGGSHTVSASFTYIPQVTVDVMTFMGGELTDSSVGGTVTMNPKNGLVPVGKTINLAAKAVKNYVFQGWAFDKDWEYGDRFSETGATWKLENYKEYGSCGVPESMLNRYIDPTDKKVHVIAVFKALSAYSADDIRISGFEGVESSAEVTTDGSGNASVTIKAVVGCALDEDYALVCSPFAGPLAYKLNGKLPDGLKLDAKTGVLSGVPKKAGSTSVTITATDPAKNAKSLTVNFEVSPLPNWIVGEFRGFSSDGHWDFDDKSGTTAWMAEKQNGLIELSVKSDGKVSVKVFTCVGTRSFSGTLLWFQDDDPSADGKFEFYSWNAKDEGCTIYFNPDGTIDSGIVDVYDKNEGWIGGYVTGMHQDTTLLVDSPFLDKYYTFAFCATTTEEYWDEDLGDYVIGESEMKSGYGYLTLKTDKKGVAKVAGQLPDGEKVSMSALVLPFDDGEKARLHVFASPSSYKKQDWFAMTLTIAQDGTVTSDENAIWTLASSFYKDKSYGYYDGEASYGGYGYDGYGANFAATLTGFGSVYSVAASLENYYWNAFCEWNENVLLQYSWKEYDGYYGGSMTAYSNETAQDFDGYFFNMRVKGDPKGAISLENKSSNPSQLSISFAKATGIFSGKTNVFFDYWQPNYKKDRYGDYSDAGSEKHVTASLPYSGVMIYDGAGGYAGYGSAVYTYKYSYQEYYGGKAKTNTKKVTLPVSLERLEP